MQFFQNSLFFQLIFMYFLLDLDILVSCLSHCLLQMFGALSDSLKFILQFFILLLKFLHSSQNILDFYVIFQRLIHFFQLNHQETLAVNRHLNDAVDVLSFMLTLEQKIENQFDGLTDGVVLREESLVGSVHLLPLHLHQKVLQLSEIGLEVEGEVIESLEIAAVYVLKQTIKKGCFFQLLEVMKRRCITLRVPFIVGPSKQVGKAVIIGHAILVIKLYRLQQTSLSRPFTPRRGRACVNQLWGGANSNYKFKQMRNKNNLPKSNRSKSRTSSLNDLVTHSEHTMSSQASVYTNTSKNSFRSRTHTAQSTVTSQEFDDYEDIISDEIDTLFITPEEERKIQDMLQFARKGKINPGNAFEIPVRVIDPQVTESSNMRFWKFASELLFASMNVYDKRVENMLQTTNRMFDNLIRVQGHPNDAPTEEETEQQHRKQRGQLIQMQVGDVGKVQAMSTYEIGSANCEDAHKLNIKNTGNQFLPDPLFNRRLQAFDSNSLKSLFMNIFGTINDLESAFSSKQNKGTEVKMEIEPKMEEKLEEQMEEEYQERVPRFVFNEIDSLKNANSNIFEQISKLRKQNVRGPLQNNRLQVKDFADEVKMFQKEPFQNNAGQTTFLNHFDSDNTQTNSVYSMGQGQNQFNFQFAASQHTQFSQDHRNDSQSQPNTYAYSQRENILSELFFEDMEDNRTEMTPWELQFKGMSLQKKVKRRIGDKEREKRGPRINPGQLDVNFLDGRKEIKANIFIRSRNNVNYSKEDFRDINLMPKSMNPFTQAIKRKKLAQKNDNMYPQSQANIPSGQRNNQQQNCQNYQYQQNSQNLSQTNTILNLSPPHHSIPSIQTTTNFQTNLVHQEHESQGVVYRSTGIRNIREIKQKINKHIRQGRKVRLSELDINISSASILVVFLHLANQSNITLTSINNETDLEITPRIQ